MIPIVFQNHDFVVVNKPEGLNFHSEDLPGLVVLVQQQLAISEIYPVHRLDKMTSGLVILALNKKTAQAFQRMFEKHEIEKFYIAISDQVELHWQQCGEHALLSYLYAFIAL